MQIVSIEDNSHEMSNPTFWIKKNIQKNNTNLLSAEVPSCHLSSHFTLQQRDIFKIIIPTLNKKKKKKKKKNAIGIL